SRCDQICRQNLVQASGYNSKMTKSQGLTAHHFSNTEIQMIPSKIYGNIPHKGSASEMRNSNNQKE
ncbi:hypothetical protein, partial [Paenibacillus riograndensis]|uniref:hypothetical protein n=1 Tax=Paenibacillus riograndensis TaxID=483937 RepID=UPI001B7FBB14